MPSFPAHLPGPATPQARRRRNRALGLGVLLFLVIAALAGWEVTRLAPQGAPAYEVSHTGPATLWAWGATPAGFRRVWRGTRGPNSTQIDLAYDGETHRLVAWDHGCARIRPGFDGGCQTTVDRTWVYQAGTWVEQDAAAAPTASGQGVMVDDTRLHRVLYINGQAQVWAWTGRTWRPEARRGAPRIPAPGSPSREPEQAFAAGYDQAAGELVVARSERTWLWDGTHWTSRPGGIDAADQGPGAQLIDDTALGRLVYAGQHETWTWDGTTWHNRPHRALPAGSMAYDPAMRRTVLVGPQDGDCSRGGCATTTWAWDGSVWTRAALPASPRLPLTRYSSQAPPLAYDAALGALVLQVSAN
ncbi:MAG: hypothetical protein J2P38_03105 [Candidatus Dormibacteraeota bacterium]|nr:hypothetical protein [Candidatus Dormibacteraeota bacterium]